MKIRIKKARDRIRKESKTIAIWGSDERGDGLDNGKWYRCWYCGWINHADRNSLGDSQSRDGVVLTRYNPDDGLMLTDMAVLDEPLIAVCPATQVRYAYKIDGNNGCSFCGTLNWRGDY